MFASKTTSIACGFFLIPIRLPLGNLWFFFMTFSDTASTLTTVINPIVFVIGHGSGSLFTV